MSDFQPLIRIAVFPSSPSRGHRAQIQAFDDTWKWGEETERTYDDILEQGGAVSILVDALKFALGRSDLMAYIVMMAIRISELHRVLKPTGSLYLHCDPTASHYLKIIIDAVFGPQNFLNEVIWKRGHGHNSANKYGPSHDVLLFYRKTPDITWNKHFHAYDERYIEKHYRHVDADGRRYKHENPTGAGVRNGATGQPWRGINPTPKNRHWVKSPDDLEKMDQEGLIHWPDKPGAWPYIKTFLDNMKGIPLQDLWNDVDVINMMSKERLRYPTQKPVALLERILSVSSNPGDIVLDPFCGCGTTIHAAQTLGRTWIGIDVTHVAIHVISDRLAQWLPHAKFDIIGQPKDLAGAQALADHDKYQFQWWATWLCGGQPFGGEKKGKDRGVDGTLEFVSRRGVHDWGVISVKGGKTVNPSMVRDLAGTVAREKAAIGVFLCIAEPSREMELEAVSAGFVTLGGVEYRKIQIRTIEQLLQGKGVDCPLRLTTAQKVPEVSRPKPARPKPAKRVRKAADGQGSLLLPIPGGRKADAQQALPVAAEPIPGEHMAPAKRRRRG